MRVQVDEAGTEPEALGLDDVSGELAADGHDLSVRHADVHDARRPVAGIDRRTPDHGAHRRSTRSARSPVTSESLVCNDLPKYVLAPRWSRMGGETEKPNHLGTATAALALFAALGAVVTVLGGVVLTLRFWSSGVPMEAIVGGLPTRFFLSVGLDVTLHLLIFGGLVALAALQEAMAVRLVSAVLAVAVLVYPFVRTAEDGEWVWIGVLAAVTTAVVSLAFGRKDKSRVPVGVALALVAFVAWRGAFEWRAVDVLDAKACLTGNQVEVGLFVGENSDSFFIGVRPSSAQPGRISEIPRSQLVRVFIGDRSGEIPCPKAPPADAGE